MSKDITHQECPFCGHSECFSYNIESGLFNCFSCGATPKKKGGLFFGDQLVPFEEQEEVVGLSLEPYIPDEIRGIRKSTLESDGLFYMTKTEQGETAHFTFPNATKHRNLWLPKNNRDHFKSSGSLDRLMGIDVKPPTGKFITITEGEWDRYSAMQMLGDYPVYSVPGANPSSKFWTNTGEDLKHYEGKIILSLDNDDPGNKLADKFYRMFPGKVLRVNHGKYKDANDFLQAGELKQYRDAWWAAQVMKPSNILCTAEDFIKLFRETPDYTYFPTGIDGLDGKMLGIHKGAFTVILAETGVGKTEFFRYLEHQCLSTTEYSMAICHREESRLRSMLGLVSYSIGHNVTLKKNIEEEGLTQEVEDSLARIGDTGRVYQFDINLDFTVDDIVEQCRFLKTALGVDYIFIEPIQDFVSAPNTNEKESLLTDLTNKLKRLAVEIDVGIVVIAHANDDGEAKYCRSIVQGAAYEIRATRDVDNPDPELSNRMYIAVGRKNRTGGGSGAAGVLVFDKDTYMLTPDIGADFTGGYEGKEVKF